MVARVSPADLEKLHGFSKYFKEVEAATGVPWEAIASIWWRESFSVKPPRTPGGPFQFDPPLDPKTMKGLLDRYSNLPEARKRQIAAAGVNDFYSVMFVVGCFLRNKCKPVITPDSPDEDILDMLWAYNGRAGYHKGDPRNSFYVYNGFDEAHDGLLIRGSIPDGKGGRKRITRKENGVIKDGRKETRPGAFVIYKQLKGELK